MKMCDGRIRLAIAAGVYQRIDTKQLAQGLDGDPCAAARARVLLRELVEPITLTTIEGQVFAS